MLLILANIIFLDLVSIKIYSLVSPMKLQIQNMCLVTSSVIKSLYNFRFGLYKNIIR